MAIVRTADKLDLEKANWVVGVVNLLLDPIRHVRVLLSVKAITFWCCFNDAKHQANPMSDGID